MSILQVTPIPSNTPLWMWFIIAVITIVVPLITVWIINVTSKRTSGDTEIEKAKIEANLKERDDKLEALNTALRDMAEKLKEHEALLEEERKMAIQKDEMISHLENNLAILKSSFRMVLTTYTAWLKEQPERLAVLQEFNTIIEEVGNGYKQD